MVSLKNLLGEYYLRPKRGYYYLAFINDIREFHTYPKLQNLTSEAVAYLVIIFLLTHKRDFPILTPSKRKFLPIKQLTRPGQLNLARVWSCHQ